MDLDILCFNIATLIAGVFVLDYGADTFLDHTVIVGRRLGISPTLVALLTAGAEYEELAVVIAAILQHRSSLALGNLMGSAIASILGAFSLGLLCHPGNMEFDSSAKMYTGILLSVTTLFVVLAFFNLLNKVTGGILVAVFALYIISIGYAIYKGITDPPQMSDSDSEVEVFTTDEERPTASGSWTSAPESSPLLGGCEFKTGGAGTIADSFKLSGTVFGLTVIAFATTLPEKLLSVLSGFRGQGGIVVATTAGSNIFLLTLCVGIVAIAGVPVNGTDTFVLFDLVIVWMSALCFVAVVFLGPSRTAGLVFLAAYIMFLVLEFTVYKH